MKSILTAKKNYIALLLIVGMVACNPKPPAPEAIGPVPNADQMAWQEMEYYGFIHFGLNTFANMEWGYGATPASAFNPSELDARQWARVAKEAGMKGIIITAKHHDGFCMWPSKYTEYSIKNSPWKDGKGDVVGDLAAACKEYGLKLGIYTSPWDRNHAQYGSPEYITYFRNQLEELLTQYGDVFEVWFDGANGGDGFYGGANETRRVDKKTYYDWPNTIKMIRKWQPKAVLFSDAGPDVRWVGNEHGFAYDTTWSTLLKDSVYGGMPDYNTRYAMGQEKGTHWIPAEADVSIRPGWFYHKAEDDKVKTLGHLMDIYYKSVGQNATLLLNLPVDDRGLVHEKDVAQLQKLKTQLAMDFKTNLATNVKTEASAVRGGHKAYGAANLVDADASTYWATDDGVTSASVTLDFGKPTTLNRLLIQEYIALGQRIRNFSVSALVDGQWQDLGSYGTIGYKRLLRLKEVTANKLKLSITDAKAAPLLSNIEVYLAPALVEVPTVSRDKAGMVSFESAGDKVEFYYTTDGTPATAKATKYTGPFKADKPIALSVISYDPATKRASEPKQTAFDLAKKDWKMVGATAETAIDDNPWTDYNFSAKELTNGLVVDLGKTTQLKGFSYLPTQQRHLAGIITHYAVYSSQNGKNWSLVKEGEFSNVLNNPINQLIRFNKAKSARYLKLVPKKTKNDEAKAVIAEFGVITQ